MKSLSCHEWDEQWHGMAGAILFHAINGCISSCSAPVTILSLPRKRSIAEPTVPASAAVVLLPIHSFTAHFTWIVHQSTGDST